MWGLESEFIVARASMVRFWPVSVVVNGDTQVQPVWAHDVSVAMMNSLKTSKSLGKIYEIAGDMVLTERQILEWMNFCLKTDRKFVALKPGGELEWHFAYWMGQTRRARVSLDNIKDVQPKVLSGNFPGAADLNVNTTPLFSPIGMSTFLHFRPQVRQLDIGLSQRPEIPGIEKGTPPY